MCIRDSPNRFQIIDGKLMPAINSIDGLGDNAAIYISEAAKDGPFLSKDDFRERTHAVSYTHLDVYKRQVCTVLSKQTCAFR